MNFKDLEIKTFYDKNEIGIDVLNDFYIPVLEKSIKYDRIGSYFRSSVFIANAKGMAQFIQNGGVIRLIGDISLIKDDIEAIKKGEDRVIDQERIEKYFVDEKSKIRDKILKDRYEFLSYLIASNKLQIRIAVVEGSNEHSKLGIFQDGNQNMISFIGSINESLTGWGPQGNMFPVFRSWKDGVDESMVKTSIKSFERMWNNEGGITKVYDFPEALKKDYIDVIPFDIDDEPATKLFLKKIINDDNKPDFARRLDETQDYNPRLPIWLKKNGLRKYQKSMIALWNDSRQRGIFEMATGTGKTVTALAGATYLCRELDKLLVIVCCPSSILVDQWIEEASSFHFNPVKAAGGYNRWHNIVRSLKIEFMEGDRPYGMIVTNKQTLFNTKNNKLMPHIEDFKNIPILFIADEVHNLGSTNIRENLPETFEYRIGLTATPKRYFDDIGTDALFDYFGQTLPHDPPIDLKFALENDFLCPYNYYPTIIYLNDDETGKYHKITKKINTQIHYKSDDDEGLKSLYRKRTAIINNAENKIEGFNRLIAELGKKKQSLFFCTEKQIDDVADVLIKNHGYHVTRITSDYKSQYKSIIDNFSTGMTDGLLAIKVIDEGLDIPSTKNGFFLASTGNPKQFIQRRGRVMRKSENKTHANIYDFIVIPNGNVEESTNIVKKALESELRRFIEFAALALNYDEAKSIILSIALNNNIYDI